MLYFIHHGDSSALSCLLASHDQHFPPCFCKPVQLVDSIAVICSWWLFGVLGLGVSIQTSKQRDKHTGLAPHRFKARKQIYETLYCVGVDLNKSLQYIPSKHCYVSIKLTKLGVSFSQQIACLLNVANYSIPNLAVRMWKSNIDIRQLAVHPQMWLPSTNIDYNQITWRKAIDFQAHAYWSTPISLPKWQTMLKKVCRCLRITANRYCSWSKGLTLCHWTQIHG